MSAGTRGRKRERTRSNGSGEDHVYNRIRMLRHERGLSQTELGRDLGLGHRTVGYLEREDYQPTISLAWEISEYFELPVDAVFSDGPMRPLSQEVFAGYKRTRKDDGTESP